MTHASNDEIRDALASLAHWTWNQVGEANRLRLSFNEETITESLLLKLTRKFSGRGLEIKSFSKPEEGKDYKSSGPTGADWEFWFSDVSGTGVRLRIQAKRLFLRSGKYESLYRTSTQHAQLQASAESFGATPLYVFYNGRISRSTRHKHPHEECCCHFPFPFFWQSGIWGCSFTHAKHLPPKNQPSPEDIPKMLPWHCLLCPRKSSGASTLPQMIKSSLDSLFDKESVKIHSKAPDWVKELPRFIASEDASVLGKTLFPEGVSHVVHIHDARDMKSEE